MSPPVVDLLRTEWNALAELGDSLSQADWDRDTDLPGWTVRDNLSHIIGTELQLLGESPPPLEGDAPAHVKNPIGQMNEAWIQQRRGRPGAEVLAEFKEVTARRLTEMESFTDEQWNQEMPGPTGIVPYSEFMNIRVMDSWVHDQDIRRAVGKPGNTTGPVADHSLARYEPAMGFVVGKKAGATEGQSVVFDLTGPQGRTIAVTVVDGRAQVSGDAPAEPTVTLTMDAETWWCLSLGRWDGESVLAEGKVAIDGDQDLGRTVLTNLAFMI
jgi:uncharacterized protein (TIGR03083 family)